MQNQNTSVLLKFSTADTFFCLDIKVGHVCKMVLTLPTVCEGVVWTAKGGTGGE